MAQLRWEYKITRFVSVACCLLLVFLAAEWLFAERFRDKLEQRINEVVSVGYQGDELPEYNFLQFPVDHYVEMVERPLFVKGRKPVDESAEEAAQVDTKPTENFNLVFTGSIFTPEGGEIALFEDQRTRDVKDRFKRLVEEDEYNGWTILDIQPDKVLIQDGLNKEVILLRAPKKKRKAVKNRIFKQPKPKQPPVITKQNDALQKTSK